MESGDVSFGYRKIEEKRRVSLNENITHAETPLSHRTMLALVFDRVGGFLSTSRADHLLTNRGKIYNEGTDVGNDNLNVSNCILVIRSGGRGGRRRCGMAFHEHWEFPLRWRRSSYPSCNFAPLHLALLQPLAQYSTIQ